MGWAASFLADEIWQKFREDIPSAGGKRKRYAKWLYERFCSEDCDDWDGTSVLELDADVNQNLYEDD